METDTLLNIERPIWKLLPLHPQPQPLESFTSYLLRLAEANRLKSIYEIFTLAGAKNGWQWIHCADFPSPVYTNLAQIAGCTPTQIMIGISREQLKKFSHIRALLQQHHESYPDYKREAQSRGKELVTRVKEAIRQVTSCGEPLTQRRICQIVGLPYIRLERYPHVKTLLDQYQSSKARREKQRTPVLEKELLERMEQAIEQLRKNGEPILPRAVAMSAHLPLQRLDDYPRVKVRPFSLRREKR